MRSMADVFMLGLIVLSFSFSFGLMHYLNKL